MRTLFDYEVREMSVTEDKLNKKDKFVLSISGEKTIEILKGLEIIFEREETFDVNLNLYGKITQKECCLKSFIRGLFVATGSCMLPSTADKSNTGYHLEIMFSHKTPAYQTSEQLSKYNVETKVTKRRDNYIVYIKSAEDIKDFLAFLPAPISVLKITDLMINRELVNNSNRRKNCDLGNVNKQVEASSKQISAINKIEKVIGLESLKEDLYATAIARRDNAEETLVELAERLGVSKSCLNHRLRKLVQIASQL
jgi:DNA-binding protein WhiA